MNRQKLLDEAVRVADLTAELAQQLQKECGGDSAEWRCANTALISLTQLVEVLDS